MFSTSSLAGKVAIVTGGSRGIGFSIAEQMVAEGISVAISGRDPRQVQDAAARLSRSTEGGAEVEGVHADVRQYEDVQRLVNTAVERFGGLDILINNAGVGRFANVADQSIEDWHQTIDTNLTGVFCCCHAAIPHLKRRQGGWIISISSLASKNPFVGGAAYCASKAALNAFSEALMQEVRQDDIKVSYILPGSVRTEFGGHEQGAGTEWKLAPADVAEVVMALLHQDRRALASRVELRPAKPKLAR